MKLKTSIFILMWALILPVFAQESYMDAESDDVEKTYIGGPTHEVTIYPQKFESKKPKNIIFLIGDGMGVAQVFAGLTANKGTLFIENCRHIGFSKTQSADDYVTDSAAGGTALSTGKRTYNGAIGVDTDTIPLKTVLEEAEEHGLSTGLVSTSAITHATPASFIAHQSSRNKYESIAADFLNTDIDVFIGGGRKHFSEREDGRNLVSELEDKGYKVEGQMDEIVKVKSGKLAGLTAEVHNERVSVRGDMLPRATKTALNILSNNANGKGFFLMVEGSQIDWGGHAGSTIYIVEEMLDFDKAIGEAIRFAAEDGKTLVVITADHECGGMTLTEGDQQTGMVEARYPVGGHTAVMVPVFSYGPGAEEFTGIMDNTEVGNKIKSLLLKR